MPRSGWAFLIVAAHSLGWLEPEACHAQAPPAPGAQVPPGRPRLLSLGKPSRSKSVPPGKPAAPTYDPSLKKTRQDLPSALPLPTPAPPRALPTEFRSAPLGSDDVPLPITLATALKLADARPLVVAAAQASTWVAEAQLTRAKLLWVPTINAGADYLRHDGGGPDFNKGILTAGSVNFFYAGAGMYLNAPLSSVIFEPLAARQVLNARHYDVQAAKNDALRDTARAYFGVHLSRGKFAGSLYCVGRGRELIDRVAQLSGDLVPRVEVDRARNLVADLEQEATTAREVWRVASADLTQVLRLDPRAVVVPLEHDHLQVTLVDPARPLDELMSVALANRPELASHQALVQAAELRVRREKARPLLPALQINGFQSPNELIQGGIFALGRNSDFGEFSARADLSYQLMWQADRFGLGNLARIKKQRGEESKALIDLRNRQDEVVADVTRARARLQSAAARVGQAERALRTAIITFNGNYEGLSQTTRFGDVLVLVNRPQEVVAALKLMKLAFDEYFMTVAEYNIANFEMFHALGYPAREVAQAQPPGPEAPVDTSRPAYLPPVIHGPPPATR